jgi:hypothetical protein
MAIVSRRPRGLSRQYDENWLGAVQTASVRVENLAAGADLTERVFFRAKYPIEVLECEVLPEAASVGVDGGNTILVTLRNITAAEDVATVTSSAVWVANTPVAMALTAANVDVAADAVIGIVVTQGATADAGQFVVQMTYRVQAL